MSILFILKAMPFIVPSQQRLACGRCVDEVTTQTARAGKNCVGCLDLAKSVEAKYPYL